jgi:lipid A ethanolaminephosphotransferase
MFSPFGRDQFSRNKATGSENLLDILQRTGVNVVWRDNDSGSKKVADRVAYEDFSKRKNSPYCSEDNCYDEVLLDGLDDLIRNTQEDMLVVLHIKGSHGPSYYKRSPGNLKVFTPECTQDNIQDCPQQTIVNAYDNTIVYTDYVLSKVIDLLQAQNSATAMLYVSDHGKSLGESGLYLHGLPYALAPEEQTHVPMEFWASKEFLADRHLDRETLLSKRNAPYSHDNLFHSMLGLFKIRTAVYRNDLDVFSSKGRHLG